MSDTPDLRRLGPPAMRTAWLFQALIAGPALLFLGIDTLLMLYYSYNVFDIYLAIKGLSLALFSAVIMFILIVQRNYPEPHPKVTARFELAKGLLATNAWLWLLLDAIFRHQSWDSYHRVQKKRIAFVSVSVVILLFVSWTLHSPPPPPNKVENSC